MAAFQVITEGSSHFRLIAVGDRVAMAEGGNWPEWYFGISPARALVLNFQETLAHTGSKRTAHVGFSLNKKAENPAILSLRST